MRIAFSYSFLISTPQFNTIIPVLLILLFHIVLVYFSFKRKSQEKTLSNEVLLAVKIAFAP